MFLNPGRTQVSAKQCHDAGNHRKSDDDVQSVIAHQRTHPAGDDADTNSQVTVPGNGRQEYQHAKERWQCEAEGVLVQSRPDGMTASQTTPPGLRLEPLPLVLADVDVALQRLHSHNRAATIDLRDNYALYID